VHGLIKSLPTLKILFGNCVVEKCVIYDWGVRVQIRVGGGGHTVQTETDGGLLDIEMLLSVGKIECRHDITGEE